jgi:predicted RecA/RadA family phage recombinase
VRNGDNTVSFDVKLVQANDSFCSKQWYKPTYLPSNVGINWLVIEHGAYRLNSADFFVGDGNITRASADSIATVQNGNAVRLFYATNCEGDTTGATCVHSGLDANRGAITQLQTSVNTIDGGRDFFLYVRVKVVFSRHIQLVINPHSSATASIFTITNPEIAAYLVFDTPLSISCMEGIVFETNLYPTVTSTKIDVNYANTYDYPPGLFGAISTQSLTDATVLRQFSNGVNTGHFITQEDQCFDEQTIHTTAETAYVFVMGEIASVASNVQCQAFNTLATAAPSANPSAAPTVAPTIATAAPSANPSAAPTVAPTIATAAPSANPSAAPSADPSAAPTVAPTNSPTGSGATSNPSTSPTTAPSSTPTGAPSSSPTRAPTRAPSSSPTRSPTTSPTGATSANPTVAPSTAPTRSPTTKPSAAPTVSALPFPRDRQLQASVNHRWMEVGQKSINDKVWSTVITKNADWVKDAVVFISLPDIGGELYTEGVFLAPKLKNIVRNGDNTVSFDVKLVQANDSFCSKQWYKPTYLPSNVAISWLVIEEGAYTMNSADYMVGKGPITRANADSTATVQNGNAIRFFYVTNCDGDTTNTPCLHSGLDANRGAITQLQTSVNTIDGGRDFFLYVRVKIVYSRHVQLVLIPHSSASSSIFTITNPETAAYLVFDTPLTVSCTEGLVFETHIFQPVTSTKIDVNYANTYNYPPGLFGAISTQSLTDATVLRQFNNGVNTGHFITQEDQCFDEQTIHTAAETAYVFVIGESPGVASTLQCLSYNSLLTDAPSAAPTIVTVSPSASPSAAPSMAPVAITESPTIATAAPSANPTAAPTVMVTVAATDSPSASPSAAPTASPSASPSIAPTANPSSSPTPAPLPKPYDRLLQANVDHIWFETGTDQLNDRNWLTITTINKDWMKNVVVFISLPDIGGELYTEGVFLAPKLKNIFVNGDNTVSFDVKLVQANDSFCSKQWYKPTYLASDVAISYLVIEQGAYSLLGNDFIVGEGPITRLNADPVATVQNGNAVRIFYPENCDGDTTNTPCLHSGLDANRGAITQLQTSVNTIDGGRDFFLYVRVRVVFSRHIQLVLIPHSSASSSIFTISNPETVAYLVFDTPLTLSCAEGLVFETHIFTPVTSTKILVDYQNTYVAPPGLFGAISTTSLTDATVLRQFNNGINTGNFITQEDQCFDEQTIHTASETAYVIVIGKVDGASANLRCCSLNADDPAVAVTESPTNMPSAAPSTAPSAAPTVSPTTSAPTTNPTPKGSDAPTAFPSQFPTAYPTNKPSPAPPTNMPTATPTAFPSQFPTAYPTSKPSASPTASPTAMPTFGPTATPTASPTFGPTATPTVTPTAFPSATPTTSPTGIPSSEPTQTSAPTGQCTDAKIPFKVTKTSSSRR